MKRKSFFTKRASGMLDPDEILVDSVSSLGSGGETLEGRIEKPLEHFPSFLFLFIVSGALLYLVWHAYALQIASGQIFFQRSQENRFLTRPIFPPRGVIYDQFKKPLVENIFSFGLVFEKDAFLQANGDLPRLIENLGVVLDKSPDFFSDVGFPADQIPLLLPARVLIIRDIPLQTVVSVVSRPDVFPGIQVVESYRRSYKHAYADAHVVGFVGRISDQELAAHAELSTTDVIGKSGIEAFYDNLLRGKGGKKIVEVDSRGAETRFSFTEDPQEGRGIMLTLDGDFQTKIYETLMHYTNGNLGASVVAFDPRNGAIRAVVSAPSFDSNAFGHSLATKEFNAILKNPLKPLFNRAIAGEFPSGSVIKPLIGAAALQERLIDPNKKIYDEGFVAIPNPYRPGEKSIFRDWKKHGWVDFYDAIAQSANVYFYMVGGGYEGQSGLGVERINKYARAFGLGSKLGLDLPGEQPGFFPNPETKAASDPEDPMWRIGDTYNISIGQGGVRVTPLQIAAMTAAVANGGKLFAPFLLDAVLDPRGEVAQKTEPRLIREGIVEKPVLAEVVKGMRQTVTHGTAWRLQDVPTAVGAKTGTAQAGSGLPHAWVSAFAPLQNPTLSVVVMVEHAGEGATVAVPIMRDILQWYFDPNRSRDL
ncbi:MAG: penicillin-binding protein 2 [Candidatus Sungbacteria bacterium]|nr:penicillin-binding protein 2 [Candidatus Sungbacteria bacterium]